jgi:alpha-beta hydrolase superfamily lysophospholipase
VLLADTLAVRSPLSPPQLRIWYMSDRYVVRGRYWPPRDPTCRVAFLYLHGIQSHGGWFEWSASLLAESGAAVILPDRRGSGANAEARGDCPHGARWFDDIDEIVAQTRSEARFDRVALVGVSWGAKLAAALAADATVGVPAAMLLIAPGFFPAISVPWSTKARIGIAALTSPTTRFPIPLNDPALFTDNPDGRAFLERDRLRLHEATARFFAHSMLLDRRLARIAHGGISTPTTLLLAERDRIIDNERTVQWLRKSVKSEPQTAILGQAAHTLEFEADICPIEVAVRQWGNSAVHR